jgi:DNA-directed RNA polymerase specialized sigma24 family protein
MLHNWWWSDDDYLREDRLTPDILAALRNLLGPLREAHDLLEESMVDAAADEDFSLMVIRSWLYGPTSQLLVALETTDGVVV